MPCSLSSSPSLCFVVLSFLLIINISVSASNTPSCPPLPFDSFQPLTHTFSSGAQSLVGGILGKTSSSYTVVLTGLSGSIANVQVKRNLGIFETKPTVTVKESSAALSLTGTDALANFTLASCLTPKATTKTTAKKTILLTSATAPKSVMLVPFAVSTMQRSPLLTCAVLALAIFVGHASAEGNNCATSSSMEINLPPTFREPPVPGIMPGSEKPKLILAQDVDWPPYAFIGQPPASDFDVAGFGHDVAHGMAPMCGIEVVTVQTAWAECWGDNKIGPGLQAGEFHGCMTYTHTIGARNRYMEFSNGILQANKPAGILTRLKDDGTPHITSDSTLEGLKIADVNGWAPTPDGLALVKNKCTGKHFSGYELVVPEASGNDAAMKLLMNGTVDGVFIYADQAHNYNCDPSVLAANDVTPEWDCDLWAGFGTKYAYVQTGMFGHAYNGTTLTISKRGSGIAANIVNPCLEKFMATKEYYDVCKKHGFESSCYPNEFFPAELKDKPPKTWELATNKLTTTCADGYCPCK